MNIFEIKKFLPHRYPFLLVDRVLDIQCGPEGNTIHAYKNITVNEPFFVGHFPHYPVVPGVLIVEALAQAAGILSFKALDIVPDDTSLFYFVGIDRARFKKPVIAGDQLHLHISTIGQPKRGLWKYEAVARVDGQVVAEGELMCARREIVYG